MTPLHQFRHKTPIHVRYADIDMMHHVNNVTYLTYLEQARIEYARDVLGWDGQMETLNIIVAHQRFDYLKPVFLNDKIEVWTRMQRLGTKSFDLEYLIIRHLTGDTEVVGQGMTTMVAYDFAANQSILFPERWKEMVIHFEPVIPQMAQPV